MDKLHKGHEVQFNAVEFIYFNTDQIDRTRDTLTD